MTEIAAIGAINPASSANAPVQVTISQISPGQTTGSSGAAGTGFGSMLTDAIANLDGKVAEADRMVARFAIDENTPIHHVTIALEEARMAVELATQVRQRLTEGYRELMNMQI